MGSPWMDLDGPNVKRKSSSDKLIAEVRWVLEILRGRMVINRGWDVLSRRCVRENSVKFEIMCRQMDDH